MLMEAAHQKQGTAELGDGEGIYSLLYSQSEGKHKIGGHYKQIFRSHPGHTRQTPPPAFLKKQLHNVAKVLPF